MYIKFMRGQGASFKGLQEVGYHMPQPQFKLSALGS